MPVDPALAALRKELHECPEIAFQEVGTRAIIEWFVTAATAGDTRFRLIRALETALVVEYRGGALDAPFTLFRADMDALPLTEDPTHPVVSKRAGFMHACGHDVHMTTLAGFVALTARKKPARNILFVFQPGEEGAGGAKRMIEAGLFDGHRIVACYALHVTDDHPLGEVATKAGVLFAMPREIDVTFTGTAGHAAFPHNASDALFAAAHFVRNVHGLLAKRLDPMRPFLFHIGKITGGTARNIVADHCLLHGTMRALDTDSMARGAAIVEEAAREAAALTGGGYRIETLGEFLPVICDATLVERLRKACAATGTRFAESETKLVGEDFGFFCAKWPSLLFWLGTRRDGEPSRALHAAEFYPPDEAAAAGISLFDALLSATSE
ncbi:MAG TPA: amidohydrolase [bacterium]|nr:amidohydrolase [bacterium]